MTQSFTFGYSLCVLVLWMLRLKDIFYLSACESPNWSDQVCLLDCIVMNQIPDLSLQGLFGQLTSLSAIKHISTALSVLSCKVVLSYISSPVLSGMQIAFAAVLHYAFRSALTRKLVSDQPCLVVLSVRQVVWRVCAPCWQCKAACKLTIQPQIYVTENFFLLPDMIAISAVFVTWAVMFSIHTGCVQSEC